MDQLLLTLVSGGTLLLALLFLYWQARHELALLRREQGNWQAQQRQLEVDLGRLDQACAHLEGQVVERDERLQAVDLRLQQAMAQLLQRERECAELRTMLAEKQQGQQQRSPRHQRQQKLIHFIHPEITE